MTTTDRIPEVSAARTTDIPDLRGYRAVHAALRIAPRRLEVAVRDVDSRDRGRARALAKYWKGYAGEVLAHHTIEDVHLFPTLVERVPAAATLIDRTDDEHHRLDELMDECTIAIQLVARGRAGGQVRATAALAALGDHMDAHLDFEDEHILPLFERHFSADEYAKLDEAAVKSIGMGVQAAFTIPFILAAVPSDVRDEMLVAAPAPLRVLYGMTRGRHERLAIRAFGFEPAEQAYVSPTIEPTSTDGPSSDLPSTVAIRAAEPEVAA